MAAAITRARPRARSFGSSHRRRGGGHAGSGAGAGLHGRAGGPGGVLELRGGGSTVTTPDPSCCSGLKDVVRHQVACLWQLFQGGGQNFGISLNMTKALQLPAACKVKTPPVSKCHVSVPGVPSASPVPAPSAGAPFFGQSPSSPAPSGSPAAAVTGSDSNSNTPAPSPAHTGAASLSASSSSFFSAAAAVAVALLAYRVL
ncbi:hypothetical protein HU200_003848 [Digitaria exilis]|uniref:Bifunctional inhibitor/plant lipid transfer protein/seed storage helical domain-containing protein n=1 Tax=Digitaria exilis TaxID=1010633 RepID=A0A835FX24_9POAL|nr:hypothetical protein HU200_003848 [Digitaria exilis]CAB3501752.1 unnamed protein product [Digitaria exilis]